MKLIKPQGLNWGFTVLVFVSSANGISCSIHTVERVKVVKEMTRPWYLVIAESAWWELYLNSTGIGILFVEDFLLHKSAARTAVSDTIYMNIVSS